MLARELLELGTDHPLGKAFRVFIAGREPTKRKAREFLASEGPRYGIREKAKSPFIPPMPCKLATTAEILRTIANSR
jgi:hypothetical protein